MKIKFSLICLLLFTFRSYTQVLTILSENKEISFRGLSVVNDRVIWACGNKGTVGISIDSGNTWKWITVHGFEKTDFRDIEAFNESSALIMGTGEPAYILQTLNGGDEWKVVYENKTKGMFLDAMEFWNEQSGIVIGDPVNGKFFVARSFDGGTHWREIPPEYEPKADTGEACFAASGTNICKTNNAEAVFVSGGKRSRIFVRNSKTDIPFTNLSETTGANSIAARNNKVFIIAGGDFNKKDSATDNCFITHDAGKTWQIPIVPPRGYRSCVMYIEKKKWLMCGLNGIDYSTDDGLHWTSASTTGFNVCRKPKKGKAIFLAGNGKIGKITF